MQTLYLHVCITLIFIHTGPTMTSDNTFEHMAGGRSTPNTYQPPSNNRYMYKQQVCSMAYWLK